MNNDQVKQFITNFNFPDPDWKEVLMTFPNFPNTPKFSNGVLTKEEECLLDGIKLIWYANHGGRKFLAKRTLAVTVVSVALIVSISLLSRIPPITLNTVLREVSAATVSATMKILSPANIPEAQVQSRSWNGKDDTVLSGSGIPSKTTNMDSSPGVGLDNDSLSPYDILESTVSAIMRK